MKANHHPQDDLLLSYAAGSLSESWSLAVASHLSLCSECRKTLEIAETVGGVLLEDIPNQQLTSTTLESVFARIDQPYIEVASEKSQAHLKQSGSHPMNFELHQALDLPRWIGFSSWKPRLSLQ